MTTPADLLLVPVSVAVGRQPLVPADAPPPGYVGRGKVKAVRTSWRDWLLASVSVGRPVLRMLLDYPESFRPEIRARVDVLRSGLVAGTDSAGGPLARPSAWLREGADPSERAAVGYRLGMAAAHWAAVTNLGLASTRHVSLLPPADARRGSPGTGGAADLYGQHLWSRPASWLVEAKGGLHVTRRSRVRGATQLTEAAARGWTTPHVQMLVAASADPRLHVHVDMATSNGKARPVGGDDATRWPMMSPAPPPSIDVFLRRAAVAGLLDASAAVTSARFVVGEARLVALAEVDAHVGLLTGAALTAMEQLGYLRTIVASATRLRHSPERALVMATQELMQVGGAPTPEPPDEPGELEGVPNAGVRYATDERGLVAVDDAGVVVVIGGSWRLHQPR